MEWPFFMLGHFASGAVALCEQPIKKRITACRDTLQVAHTGFEPVS